MAENSAPCSTSQTLQEIKWRTPRVPPSQSDCNAFWESHSALWDCNQHAKRPDRSRSAWKWAGGPQRGEVPHLPVVKKYLSSHATPGTRGEVQNAITWALSAHINKELSFIPTKLLFASMSFFRQAKL